MHPTSPHVHTEVAHTAARPALCTAPHGVQGARGVWEQKAWCSSSHPSEPAALRATEVRGRGTYPVRLSSGPRCTPGGCRDPVPGKRQYCPGDRRSGCSRLCSRVWHEQGGELQPLAPPQGPGPLQRQEADSYCLIHKWEPHEGHFILTAPSGGTRWYGLLLSCKNFDEESVLLFPNRNNYQVGLVSKPLKWQNPS